MGKKRNFLLSLASAGGLIFALLPASAAHAVVSDNDITTTNQFVNAFEGPNNFIGLGSFTEPGNPSDGNAFNDYTLSIDWGDGVTNTSGVVQLDTNNNRPNDYTYFVNGSHTYADESPPPTGITVTITSKIDADQGTLNDSVNVADLNNNSCQGTNGALCGPQLAPVTEGQALSNTVAYFGDSDTSDPTNFAATINWGDNTSSPGTVSLYLTSGGESWFAVSGNHAYTEWHAPLSNPGCGGGPFQPPCPSYNISVQVLDGDGNSLGNFNGLNNGVLVQDAALGQTSYNAVTAKPRKAKAQTLVTFSDGDPGAQVSDYTASINWGDGTAASPGIVTGPVGGPFSVSGSHSYSKVGSYTIGVTVGEADNPVGTTTLMTDFATISH